MNKHVVAIALAVASLAVVSSASADEVGTFTMPVTTIVGRAPRPSVVVELSRSKPEIKLSDLNNPAVEKILRAGTKAPF